MLTLQNKNSLYGIAFMLANTLALACIDIAVKVLRESMHAGMIMFLYKFSLLIIVSPWILSDGIAVLKTKRLLSHIVRSLFSVAGGLCFYHGLFFIDMADAAALENLQYLLVATLGMVFFSEKVSLLKIVSILIAFLGAFIVVNPVIINNPLNAFSSIGYNKGHLLIILAISFWACNTITVKLLSNTEHNKTQMFYLLLTASLLSVPPAFIKWGSVDIMGIELPLSPEMLDLSNIHISLQSLLLIGFVASCYFIHGTMYFNALKYELSIVIPFRYSKLMFSAFLGWLIFAEQHRNSSYIGYVLIVTAGLLLVRSQMHKK